MDDVLGFGIASQDLVEATHVCNHPVPEDLQIAVLDHHVIAISQVVGLPFQGLRVGLLLLGEVLLGRLEQVELKVIGRHVLVVLGLQHNFFAGCQQIDADILDQRFEIEGRRSEFGFDLFQIVEKSREQDADLIDVGEEIVEVGHDVGSLVLRDLQDREDRLDNFIPGHPALSVARTDQHPLNYLNYRHELRGLLSYGVGYFVLPLHEVLSILHQIRH